MTRPKGYTRPCGPAPMALLPGFTALAVPKSEEETALRLDRIDPPAHADVIAARHGWPVMWVWLALDRLVTAGKVQRIRQGDRIIYGRAR